MKDQETIKDSAADQDAPLALTTEQAAQVSGGLSAVRGGVCCQTCASVGRPLFSALAAELS